MYSPVSKVASGQIGCPKHRIPLTVSKKLWLNNGKSVLVSFCPQCNCWYTNDSVVLKVPNGKYRLDDKVIFWSGQRVHVMKNGKVKMKPVNPVLRNMPLNIIHDKKELTEFHHVTSVINTLYLSNKRTYSIQGYFEFDNNRFYCFYNNWIRMKDLKDADLSRIKINDPNNYLNGTKSGRAFLSVQKEWELKKERLAAEKEKAKEEMQKKQEEMIQKAYPGLYYTLPLLGPEDSQEYCPFCHSELQHSRAANYVLYMDRKPSKSVYFTITGCDNCNIPLSTAKDLEKIRKLANEGTVKILYASHYPNVKQVIAAGQQKVVEIPAYVPTQTKAKKELPFTPKTWTSELPDLSSISQSRKVLVFAKKCMCASCRKKFNQNTIVDRTVAVFSSNGTPVKINVQFCMGCGQYFLALRSFYAYRKMYGSLNFQFVLDEDVTPEMLDWDKFAADSVLSRNGYSVKAGVSILQRQKALSYILDNHIAEKHEIITLLNQFIQLQKNRLPEACERWREDLLFVNQYRVDEQKWAGVKTLAQGGRFTQKE